MAPIICRRATFPATCAFGKGNQTSTARSTNSKDKPRSSPLILAGPVTAACSQSRHRRRPFEFETALMPNPQLIPLGSIPDRLTEIPRTETTVLMCKTGVRSARAIEFLRREGFENLLNLEGGLDAWREEVDPTLRKY